MLHIHRCASARVLADALAGMLATSTGDVFAAEVVAVPAKGVERWLAQRLSHVLGAGSAGSGVCANVHFPNPDALLDSALTVDTSGTGRPVDPWDPQRAVWPLLEVIDSTGGKLGVRSAARSYQVATRLAEIFARYGQERPVMVQRWAAGADTGDDGAPLPEDLRWQPELWRGLRAAIGVPSPAETLPETLERLLVAPELVKLPERFSVFGLTRLATARAAVLTAVARHREVHLWINHPSAVLWDAVAAGGGAGHPLSASMAREVICLQRRLVAASPGAIQRVHPSPARPATLLGHLQEALAADRVGARTDRPTLAPGDDSVVVHSCHGRARQVEVLREAILERLAADPTLQPRDVLVICPDIEEFAPLVAAAFTGPNPDADQAGSTGSSAERGRGTHPVLRLRVSMADRSPRANNPLLDTAASVLKLAGSRAGAGEVLDLAGTEVVCRRFGFVAEDIARLREWVGAARICWGFDAGHRASWGLGGIAAGTWRDGLDRLLLGAAMDAEAGWLGAAAPCGEADSADIDLLGRFAEFVDRLAHAVRSAAGSRPVSAWADLLATAVLSLAAPAQPWQEGALLAELAELADSAAGHDVAIGLRDMSALWSRRCVGRPSRTGFRTGTLTVATMVPMRSVPHRVIALLGLDDGVFPRTGVTDGDDLLARSPRPGERDPRSEDRQLLLDAICAADEHLMIVCTGADERTGLEVPPAVPLAELLDAIDQVALAPDGERVRDHVIIRHPLQAFDPRNFGVEAANPPYQRIRRPISFDVTALAGARALLAPRSAPVGLIDGPLPGRPVAEVELENLRGMFRHPARAFLAQRLGVRAAGEDTEPADELPVELDKLAEWSVGERFLAARLRELAVSQCLELEWRRGTLPPGALGRAVATRIGRTAETIAVAALPHLQVGPRAVDVCLAVEVASGPRTVVGTVGGLHGNELVRVSYSGLGGKQLIAAWLDLLAITITHPGIGARAVVIGRDRSACAQQVIGPIDPGEAPEMLADLVALAEQGLSEPLPIPVRTAYAYAGAVHRGMKPDNAMRRAASNWQGARFGGEATEPPNVLVWGPGATLADLGEQRLAKLATRVWEPILRASPGTRR